jgi:cGMP-dependent protein kinase
MGICLFYYNPDRKKVDIIVPNNEVITGKIEEKEILSGNKKVVQFDIKNIKKNTSNASGIPSNNSTEFFSKTRTYSQNINHEHFLSPTKSKKNHDSKSIDKKINKDDENINKNEEKNNDDENDKKEKVYSKTEIIQLKQNNNNNEINEKSKFFKEKDKIILNHLKNHYLFETFNEDDIKNLINSSIILTINSGKIIFNENEDANSFYIIKKGSVKLYDSKIAFIISKDYSSFGEIGLIENDLIKRKYSAITEENTELFVINKKSYISILKKQNNKTENKEKIFNYFLEKELVFQGITNEEKINFCSLIRYKKFEDKEKNIKIKIKENDSNCFESNNICKIFFIGKGRIQLSMKQNNNNYLNEIINEGNNFGLPFLLFYDEKKIQNLKKKKITDDDFFIVCSKINEILFLNEKIFIECFGLNYKNYLLNSCALFSIKNDYVFNTIETNCNIPEEEVYEVFKIRKYKQNSLVFQKGISSNNSKSIILLEGKLTGFKHKNSKTKFNYLFDGNNLFIFKDFEEDFVTVKDSIIFETSIEQFQNFLIKKKLNSTYIIILYNILNKFQIFNEIDIHQAFDIVNHIHVRIYKQNHIIQKIGNEFKYIYLIENGTIGVYNNEKSFKKIIDTGDSFGELSILQEQKSPYNFIVNSKEVILYQINIEYYMELLTIQSINDFIKYKMYIESDISLNDLYYLSYLGRGRFGNVCLIHNEIFFYAIKAISKSFAEKQKFGVKYLFFEKNTLSSMDHPFVLKLIKTLKNENWLFFLMEYISGINMGEYLDGRKNNRNLFETKFYSASIFLAIEYIHKKKIIHRDIKPANIMIDKKGYIKIIDFGTAKILNNENEKTKTVIGSPNFISPEVLLGKGYSFSCDYWSIGICIYYIYYGILPFGNNSLEILDTYKEIIEKEVSFPDNSNIELNSLLNTLLDKNENNRHSIIKMIRTHFFFKDIDFDALLSYKIKPPFIPLKDQRANDDNLQNKNSPFIYFMENQKSDTKTTVTLKAGNNIRKNSNNNFKESIPNNWFEIF